MGRGEFSQERQISAATAGNRPPMTGLAGDRGAGRRVIGETWSLLWAKRRPGETAGTWHSLIGHCLDVMAVAQRLWEHSLPPPVRTRMAASLGLEEDAAMQWVSLWAGLHDMGKASPGFQGRWGWARDTLASRGLSFPRTASSVHHGVIGAAVLPRLLRQSGLPSRLALPVGVAVAGHHGVFPRADQWVDLGPRQLGDDRWEAARLALYHTLVATAGISAAAPTGSPDHTFYLLLAGLTCIADWIGSMEERFLPAGEIGDPVRYATASLARAGDVLSELGWTRPPADGPFSFDAVFGFPPNLLQETVMETARPGEPALVIIEAPMGLGKTEAAFQLGDAWLSALGLAGGYVALPTEATSNQMFGRFHRFLARRFPGGRVNLQLVHGHAALSPTFREVRIAADSPQAGVVAEEWFIPKKRALLAPFGVGTVDQVLLSVLRVRHGFLRLFGLAGKTLVVDEVHAYDTYMSTLLDRLLNWLSALGSPVLLLSATLPDQRRVQLIRAYAGRDAVAPEAPYPRITWASRSGVGCHSLPLSGHKEVRLDCVDAGEVAPRLARAVEGGGCAVWICNTVGRAQQAYLAMREAAPGLAVDLLHAQYPFEEREERELRVVAGFGKEGPRPSRAVLVATQVVEQSLDVDFDLMVTDPAPVDLVLQRAGRLHRHNRPGRPPAMIPARLWLVRPLARDGVPDCGESAAVYEEYLVLRSWLLLEGRDRLSLPGDIDPLIQEVYGAGGLPGLTDPLALRLEEARRRMEAAREEGEREATLRLIKPPWYADSILEAFDADLDEEDPRVHQAFQALTRLGPPSVGLVCLHQGPAGPTFRAGGEGPVDLGARPSLPLVEQLLRRAVRVSHRGLVRHLLAQPVPEAWHRSPFLRHHRLALFSDHVFNLAGWQLVLDPALGLVIRRQEP